MEASDMRSVRLRRRAMRTCLSAVVGAVALVPFSASAHSPQTAGLSQLPSLHDGTATVRAMLEPSAAGAAVAQATLPQLLAQVGSELGMVISAARLAKAAELAPDVTAALVDLLAQVAVCHATTTRATTEKEIGMFIDGS